MKWILPTALMLVSLNLFAAPQFSIQAHAQKGQVQTLDRVVDTYSYNFGRVRLYSSDYVRYTLTNTGDTVLTLETASISGSGFRASHSCEAPLAPGAECSFDIGFSPFFEGFQSGNFHMAFQGDYHLVVDLWGEGVRF